MIQKNEDVCERHWFKLQWVLTPFSDSPGRSIGIPKGENADKLKKEHPLKRTLMQRSRKGPEEYH